MSKYTVTNVSVLPAPQGLAVTVALVGKKDNTNIDGTYSFVTFNPDIANAVQYGEFKQTVVFKVDYEISKKLKDKKDKDDATARLATIAADIETEVEKI